VAAYELARAGKSVLLIDRGSFAGAKNITGGRIYVHSLARVFAKEVLSQAPFERKITHERISLMTPDANFTIDFSSRQMMIEGQESFSVLRASFDQWLAERAEGAGADCIFGLTVERLLKDDSGKICGVALGEDEITVSIIATGFEMGDIDIPNTSTVVAKPKEDAAPTNQMPSVTKHTIPDNPPVNPGFDDFFLTSNATDNPPSNPGNIAASEGGARRKPLWLDDSISIEEKERMRGGAQPAKKPHQEEISFFSINKNNGLDTSTAAYMNNKPD
jgi:hypothetical protein